MDIYQLTSPWIIPQVTNPSYEWIIQQVTNPGPKLVDNPPGLWISNLGISNLKIPQVTNPITSQVPSPLHQAEWHLRPARSAAPPPCSASPSG
jgi:hypothetical protein